MWRNIDSNALKILKTKYKENEKWNYLIAAVILFMVSAFFLAADSIFDWVAFIFGGLAMLSAVILMIIQIMSYMKFKELKKCMGTVTAEYNKAVLVGKYAEIPSKSSFERNYFAKVNIDGRKIKIPCTIKVYKELKKGDTVYIVDLVGEQGAYPQFCVAVADIENYIGCRYMSVNEMLDDLRKIMRKLDDLKTYRFAKLTGDIDSAVKLPSYQEEKDKLELYARELSDIRNAKIYRETEDRVNSFLFKKQLNELEELMLKTDEQIYQGILEIENNVRSLLSYNTDFSNQKIDI